MSEESSSGRRHVHKDEAFLNIHIYRYTFVVSIVYARERIMSVF